MAKGHDENLILPDCDDREAFVDYSAGDSLGASQVLPWEPVFQHESLNIPPRRTAGGAVRTVPEYPVYETYDPAMASWIRTWAIRPRTGRRLDIVFATPDRAFARWQKRLDKMKVKYDQGPKAVGPHKKKTLTLPLPFGSLDRGDMTLDPSRWHEGRERYGGYSYDSREITQWAHPKPVDIPYTLTIWTDNTIDQTAYEVSCWRAMRLNAQETYIRVLHTEELGVRCVPVVFDGATDVSELEAGERQRILRYDYRFTLKGWIAMPCEKAKTILTGIFELSVDNSVQTELGEDAVLDEVIFAEADAVSGASVEPDLTRAQDGPFPEPRPNPGEG